LTRDVDFNIVWSKLTTITNNQIESFKINQELN